MERFRLPPKPYPREAALIEAALERTRQRLNFRTLSKSDRRRIQRSDDSARVLAVEYGITVEDVNYLRRRRRRQPVGA